MNLAMLVIIGSLAVSTNAAGGFALDKTSDVSAEASVEEASLKKIAEHAGSEDVSVQTATDSEPSPPDVSVNETDSDLGPVLGENSSISGQTSILDIIPYPMNIILRTFGKDALKKFDVESMCDTIQLIDWKKYQKLLEVKDFTGFKEKISHDAILTATAEAFQQTAANYINKMTETISKTMKIDNLDNLQKNVKEFLDIISVSLGAQNKGAELQKNINKFVGNMSIDKKAKKEILENLQKNVNKMLEVLATTANAQNSLKVSSKIDFSDYNKGSPAA